MQRVRVGLTGLACVFLLVLLAASLFGMMSKDSGGNGAAGRNASSADTNGEDAPKDPLAELGVAPGNAPPDSQKTRPAPATATPAPAHAATAAASRATPTPAASHR